MPDVQPHTGSLQRRSRFTIIFFLAASLVLIAGAAAYYLILVKAPHDLANSVAGGIRDAFNITPRVSIQQTVVIEQTTPILEVATVSRDLFVEHSWSHTWLGSTKSINLQASYTAKAGFDLHEPFLITIERSPLRVFTQLPPSKLLSLELTSYRIVRDENGWWNRIADADREQAMRDLQGLARRQAEESGMLDEARNSAQARIREIVERNGVPVLFEQPGPAQ